MLYRTIGAAMRAGKAIAQDGNKNIFNGSSNQRVNGGGTLVVVDGFEQCGFWSRNSTVLQSVRHPDLTLLVTAHRLPRGFMTLHQTTFDRALLRRLAIRMLQNHGIEQTPCQTFLKEHFDDAVQHSDGNAREVWFALYDAFQSHFGHGTVPLVLGPCNE
ncbi:MAG: hypothetical protein AAFP69_16205 [Planctomycetota bacterium]